jgi:predicted SprT family Zn-dependent metalloprotease
VLEVKNLDKLYFECEKELRRINMDFSDKIVRVSVNGRLRTTLGVCNRDRRTGMFTIDINPALLADNVDDMEVKDTIVHEMIHNCPGCFDHGYEWKRRADRVNRMLGYHVSRTASRADMEAAGVEVKREEFKYALQCVKCGNQCKYKRWSKSLENPSRYRCGRCHGDLKVVCLDGNREIWGVKVANRAE